jgi:hypothetical protein
LSRFQGAIRWLNHIYSLNKPLSIILTAGWITCSIVIAMLLTSMFGTSQAQYETTESNPTPSPTPSSLPTPTPSAAPTDSPSPIPSIYPDYPGGLFPVPEYGLGGAFISLLISGVSWFSVRKSRNKKTRLSEVQ